MTNTKENVIKGLLSGKTNNQITNELGLALPTIKMHISSLFRQYGVSSRLQLVLTLLKSGRQNLV